MKYAIVLGTRPEIVKLAPVIWALRDSGASYSVIDTGQHEMHSMSGSFYESMGYDPDYRMKEFDPDRTPVLLSEALMEIDADRVIVQGDTDSAFLGALCAVARDIPVAHVEAGLRSGNLAMREERNRIAIDRMSKWRFAPTLDAALNLGDTREVFGNTIADVLASKSAAKTEQKHILLTIHRRETVDKRVLMQECIYGAAAASKKTGLPVVFPVHPRTMDMIERHGISMPSEIRWTTPKYFDEFLEIEAASGLFLTDSGGLQEEACILGIPCVTLRNDTERTETIEIGANVLAGHNSLNIAILSCEMLGRSGWTHPYGSGDTGRRIVAALS